MKKIFFLFSFLITILIFSQNNENAMLYSMIINKFENSKIAVDDSTSIGHMELSDYEFTNFKESLVDIEKETFDDFIEKNRNSSKLIRVFTTNKEIIFINKKEKKDIFRNGEGWQEFYETYGQTQGILSFSNIGFNKTKTQALLYYGNQSHWLAGSGHLVLFEKINGKWELSISTMLWIS